MRVTDRSYLESLASLGDLWANQCDADGLTYPAAIAAEQTGLINPLGQQERRTRYLDDCLRLTEDK